MASAPLNWLLKIGGDALQTTAQTLSAAVNELKSGIAGVVSSLAPVATSNDYNDLDNTPSIPAPVDISNKADKVANATSGNFASLDANGNLVDSGKAVFTVLPITDGGTGNSNGYIRTGQASGTTVGASATCEGVGTTALGIASHAEGVNTNASKMASHAEGNGTTASGSCSHAEGDETTAAGDSSHAEGSRTTASGANSHAEGSTSAASGVDAHAEGYNTTASGRYSHAEGSVTKAWGDNSHAEGTYTIANSNYSHAGGRGSADYPVEAKRSASFVHGNAYLKKFRETTLAENGINCFGFDMSGEAFEADIEIATSQNGLSGTISNVTTVTVYLDIQGLYLLVCSGYTISSGAFYGSTVNLITGAGLSTGTPTNLAIKASTNSPVTIAAVANNKITIKNGAATRAVQFTLIRLL